MKKYILISVLVLIGVITYIITSNVTDNEVDNIIKSNNGVTYEDSLVFEYGERYYLKDYVTINGEFIDEDVFIDTLTIGDNKYSFIYTKNDINYEGYIEYEVVDTTAPLVFTSSSYTKKIGSEMDLEESIFCADNHDSIPDCVITGDYDMNKVGTYNLTLTATDSFDNQTVKNFNLYVKSNIATPTYYEPTPLPIEDVIEKHKNEFTQIGIDASSWQGDIDWNKVKDNGVEFVILRIGFGWDEEHKVDSKFFEYLEGAQEVGLDIGIYYYSYASSIEEAEHAANWVVETLDGIDLELPISYDWEEWGNFNAYEISLTELNLMADAFINIVEDAGYEGVNYGSASYLNNIWKTANHRIWLAHYTMETNYAGDYFMWQLTSSGKVDGIEGGVDLNVLYLN